METNNKQLGISGALASAFLCAVLLATAGCGSPNADDEFRDGAAAYESGDYATARKHFKRFSKLNPDNETAAYNLGMACLKNKEYGAAADAFKQAESLSKNGGSEFLEALAQTLRLSGKPDAALDVYDRAIAKTNRQPNLLAGMAQCHIDKGRFGHAEKLLKDAITISGGKEPAALFNFGVLYSKPAHNDPAKSALYYHNFLRHHRNNPEFAAETVRAAQALASLDRSIPPDLQEKVILKIAESGRYSRDKVKRLNLLFEAWYVYPASKLAMAEYIKHADPNSPETKEMIEILELTKKY